MVANHFVDDETQEFFGKFGIEIGVAGQLAQAGYLFLFAGAIGWGQAVFRLIFADRLGHFEAFCQHEHQRRIDIVDAFAILLKLFVHFTLPQFHLFRFQHFMHEMQPNMA